jgi:hypothetical protein
MTLEILRKREIPMWIVTITGFWMMIAYFFPIDVTTSVATELKAGSTLLASFVLVYSGIVAIRNNAVSVMRRTERVGQHWYWNAYALAVMLVYIISALIDPKLSAGTLPNFLYSNVAVPGFGALFSSLAFWNMSALLHIVKARTRPVAVLIIVMTIGLLAGTPWVAGLFPAIATFFSWISDYPSAAGSRGIIMSIAIGAIALSIRLLLQEEKGWMGER